MVFDGVRHSEVLTSLRQILYPSICFLYIEIDDLFVNARLATRDNINDAHALQSHSTEAQVSGILKSKADLIIDGTVSIVENVNQICKWLHSRT